MTRADPPEDAAFAPLGDWSSPGEMRAAICLLTDPAGRLPLQLRDDAPGVRHPGLWSAFGGAVEGRETLCAAMAREWTEQTGLILPEAAFRPSWRVLSPDALRARIHVFTARADVAPGDIRLGEGAGFGFFTPGQARALPKPAHVALAIDAHLAEA